MIQYRHYPREQNKYVILDKIKLRKHILCESKLHLLKKADAQGQNVTLAKSQCMACKQ